MDFELTQDELEVQKWARTFSREFVLPLAKKHSEQKIERETLERLSQEGFMTLLVPEELGGLGISRVAFALVGAELAYACGSVAVTVGVTNMIADVIMREGSAYHKEKFLKRLTSGESVTASFCLTENSSGSDAAALRTLAKKTADGYEITGEKIYVTNGAWSDFFLVMASTDPNKGAKGISAFLVDRNSKGVTIGNEENKEGLTGSSTIRISFENVIVPEENRVGPEGDGFKIAMRALDGGRVSVSAQALGTARAAFDEGVKYAKQREAFGKPIASYQAIQWKLADAATSIAASEALMLRAAWLRDQKKPSTLEASMAKVFVTEAAVTICEDMLHIHGGYGYIKEYPVERFLRDVRVTMLYEGTSEIQRLVIARDLLK